MRYILPILALVSCTLAAPSANNPQLIIDHHDPQPLVEATTKPELVATNHAVIETNQTIYAYLSQQLRRVDFLSNIGGSSYIASDTRSSSN
jgi:hypothetical protein